MWNNFCAVTVDLFWFALGVHPKSEIVVYRQPNFSQYKLTSKQVTASAAVNQAAEPIRLAAPATSTLLPVQTASTATAHTTVATQISQPVVQTSTERAEPVDSKSAASSVLHAPVVMYVSAIEGAPCIHAPHMDFDAVIETLPYGTAVTVIGYQGRFASVNRSNITGWVDKDTITPQKHDVWPMFVSGVTYEATAKETLMTRQLLLDMFGAGAFSLPLQAGEYIAVRLKSEHRSIVWNRKRPRIAGRWATLLRGAPGIHIGVTPKTDTIIEWQTDDGEGRLGYIEGVAPDLTLTMSAVGVGEAGRYVVKTMSEDIWRELRPVFIEVA